MAEYGGKGSFRANAVSFANSAGGKVMSMMGKAVSAGTQAAKYKNPKDFWQKIQRENQGRMQTVAESRQMKFCKV